MRKKLVVPIASLAGAGTVTVALIGAMNAPGRSPALPSQEDNADNRAPRVEVVSPARKALSRSLTIPATLAPYETAGLHAKASGYVSSVEVDIGDRVRKGDALVRLEIPEMTEELHRAEAELGARRARTAAARALATEATLAVQSARAEFARARAEAELERATARRQQELYDAEAIPAQALDEYLARVAVAEAELKLAEAQIARAEGQVAAAEADVRVAEGQVAVAEAEIARLRTLMEYATVRAPFDGVITRRLVDPGAFVRSATEGESSPLLRLVRTDVVRLVLEVAEPEAPRVRPGTALRVRLPALGGEPIEATIARTAVALNPDTHTMRVEADLNNEDGRFQAGMYAHVVVGVEEKLALVIPSKAIRVTGGDTTVLVAADGVARRIPIAVGYDDGVKAEVIEGLHGDELVITAATSAVAPGAPVQPVHDSSSKEG